MQGIIEIKKLEIYARSSCSELYFVYRIIHDIHDIEDYLCHDGRWRKTAIPYYMVTVGDDRVSREEVLAHPESAYYETREQAINMIKSINCSLSEG